VTLAAATREAVREHPFLYDALRAGVVNYSAAARFLDVDGETDAVVAALRRYASELSEYDPQRAGSAVSMQSGLGITGPDDDPTDALVALGDQAFVPDGGSLTGLVASGGVGADGLREALGRLAAADIAVEAAAVGGGALVVVVGRRDGPDAVRVVEGALGT